MEDMNIPDYERSPSRITEEERRLIDEAVAAGEVTRVPIGASAFKQDYIWAPNGKSRMNLQPVGVDPDRKSGYAWRKDFSASAKLARTRKRKAEV